MASRLFSFLVFTCFMSGTAFAASFDCTLNRMCGSAGPCSELAVDATIRSENGKVFLLYGDFPEMTLTPFDEAREVLLRGTTQDQDGYTAYLVSVFSDLSLFIDVQTFVGQGGSLNMSGTCQGAKN